LLLSLSLSLSLYPKRGEEEEEEGISCMFEAEDFPTLLWFVRGMKDVVIELLTN
jgi:hypothetical protein